MGQSGARAGPERRPGALHPRPGAGILPARPGGRAVARARPLTLPEPPMDARPDPVPPRPPAAAGGPLERLFRLSDHGTSVRTELLAGLTTFLTMAYIVFINPSILAEAGMDRGAVFVATCLAAALGSLIMGLWANWPVAMAPGMGLNAYFAYAMVQGLGFTWQAALGAVFISGLCFLAVTPPPSSRSATCTGPARCSPCSAS